MNEETEEVFFFRARTLEHFVADYQGWGEICNAFAGMLIKPNRFAPNQPILLLVEDPAKFYENLPVTFPQEWRTNLPEHVCVGVRITCQDDAERLIPSLLNIPASVRFLLCEPLVESIYLDQYWRDTPNHNNPTGAYNKSDTWDTWLNGLQWVIAGGDSSPLTLPSHPTWFQFLLGQCDGQEVPFYFTGWGEVAPFHQLPDDFSNDDEWPTAEIIKHLRVDDVYEGPARQDPCPMYRVGSARSGRLLYGREHRELPFELLSTTSPTATDTASTRKGEG